MKMAALDKRQYVDDKNPASSVFGDQQVIKSRMNNMIFLSAHDVLFFHCLY